MNLTSHAPAARWLRHARCLVRFAESNQNESGSTSKNEPGLGPNRELSRLPTDSHQQAIRTASRTTRPPWRPSPPSACRLSSAWSSWSASSPPAPLWLRRRSGAVPAPRPRSAAGASRGHTDTSRTRRRASADDSSTRPTPATSPWSRSTPTSTWSGPPRAQRSMRVDDGEQRGGPDRPKAQAQRGGEGVCWGCGPRSLACRILHACAPRTSSSSRLHCAQRESATQLQREGGSSW